MRRRLFGWIQRSRRERNNRLRGRALTGLAKKHLPAEYDVTGDGDAWPLVGAALVSRATTTLEHVLAVQHRRQAADAGTLGRSLYEHVVHLAWLAADPSAARIETWRKDDLRSRLAADTKSRELGIKLLEDPERAALEGQIEGMAGEPLILEQLASAADKYWVERLPGFVQDEVRSFAGLYVVLYRNYSGTAHPSYRGINPVVQDVNATRRRVVLEGPYDGRGPFGMATVTYALGLYVAASALGWPEARNIGTTFDRFSAS